MRSSSDQLSKLLAQRYSVSLSQDHWHNFLKQYHYNQRVSALSSSGHPGILANLRYFFFKAKPARLAYAAGIAYASASFYFYLFPRDTEPRLDKDTPAHHQIIPQSQPSSTASQQTSHQFNPF